MHGRKCMKKTMPPAKIRVMIRPPLAPMIIVGSSFVTMAVGTVVSLWMFERLVRSLEVMAMAKALDEMEDRLSDVERADLEGRIREKLFK